MQKSLQLRGWLTQFLLLEGLGKENLPLITVGAIGTGQDQEVRTDTQGIVTEMEIEDLQLLESLERDPKVPSMERKRRNINIDTLIQNLEAEVEKDIAAKDQDHILVPEESINIGQGLILIPKAERSIDTSQNLQVDHIQVVKVRRRGSRVLTLSGTQIQFVMNSILQECMLSSAVYCVFVSHHVYLYIIIYL